MYSRELQNKLLELSEHWSIIPVTGPRQSGKTTLCKMAFPDQMLKMYKNADINIFNSICKSIPKAKNLTTQRKNAISSVKKLLGDMTFEDFFEKKIFFF